MSPLPVKTDRGTRLVDLTLELEQGMPTHPFPDLGEIDIPELEQAEREAGVRVDGHIVLLCSGFHARHWPSPTVVTSNPGLTAAATHWLADRRSRAHGVEGPSTGTGSPVRAVAELA